MNGFVEWKARWTANPLTKYAMQLVYAITMAMAMVMANGMAWHGEELCIQRPRPSFLHQYNTSPLLVYHCSRNHIYWSSQRTTHSLFMNRQNGLIHAFASMDNHSRHQPLPQCITRNWPYILHIIPISTVHYT